MPDGRAVERLTLSNGRGAEVDVLTYGGVVQAVRVPDRDGVVADVALGYDTLDAYRADRFFVGPLIGRYANRIAGGRFTLDGRAYALARNDGPNHLHGGPGGFHAAVWQADAFHDAGGAGVVLSRVSPAGEEGYPGTLDVRVTYTLTPAAELVFDYAAVTDAPTPVSLTQHACFDLSAGAAPDVLEHELLLAASRFTPVDAMLVPSGDIRPVTSSPFDFTAPTPIGARIDEADDQLRLAGGYDHNFVIDRGTAGGLVLAARVREPRSGRVMEVHTTEPGVQLYTGNAFDGRTVGKRGRVLRRRAGFALETQHFPDSPNQPQFPSTILRPGEAYRSRTVYRFGVDGVDAPPR